jgi:hypothetical protein
MDMGSLHLLKSKTRIMNNNDVNLTATTIAELGLTLSKEKINAAINPKSRIFRYPELEHVFVMESDLYGNPMPKGSCFLAFNGRNGMVGKHITIEKLSHTSVQGIRELVESNTEG